MIFFINEDKNKKLINHIPWFLPDGIKHHLENIKDNNKKSDLTKNHTTKEAYDHLIDILQMNNEKGIKFEEMKRIKHWFDTNQNSKNTKQYELYGGDIMMNWVNNQLNSARQTAELNRKAKIVANQDNVYKKKHDNNTNLTVTQVDDKTPTYNPITGNKQNRIKELTRLKENKTILLTEKQQKELKLIFINNKKKNNKIKH